MFDSHDVADWMIIGHLAQANAAQRQAVYNATTPQHRLAMDRAAERWDAFWWYLLVVPCVIDVAVGVVLVMALATPGVKLVVIAPLAAVCVAVRSVVATAEAKRSARRQAVTLNRQAIDHHQAVRLNFQQIVGNYNRAHARYQYEHSRATPEQRQCMEREILPQLITERARLEYIRAEYAARGMVL